jgi:type IV pilus assembly protein PilE
MHRLKSGHPAGTASRGFTLLELVIVMAIIAILATLAMPSYIAYIARTNRAAAQACLEEHANYMERLYATNLSYTATLPSLGCANAQNTGSNYTYSFAAGTLTTTAYTVQAVPTGAQAARDAQCGTLSLNQSGTKNVTGAAGVATCWK